MVMIVNRFNRTQQGNSGCEMMKSNNTVEYTVYILRMLSFPFIVIFSLAEVGTLSRRISI